MEAVSFIDAGTVGFALSKRPRAYLLGVFIIFSVTVNQALPVLTYLMYNFLPMMEVQLGKHDQFCLFLVHRLLCSTRIH